MSITKHLGIKSLRSSRALIEESLANAAAVMTEDYHTIQAQKVRIAELELSLEKAANTDVMRMHQIARLERRHIDAVDQIKELKEIGTKPRSHVPPYTGPAHVGKSDLVRKMKKGQMERMENVCRLASAAIHHLRGSTFADSLTYTPSNVQTAIDLLKPLATGVHDVYEYNGATDRSSTTRPHDTGDSDLYYIGAESMSFAEFDRRTKE